MKKFILKALDVILTIVMIGSVIYSLFNLVMSLLPIEIQTQVYGWLHMSSEYIATFSVSAAINAAVLVATKIAQTYTRIKLSTKLLESENVIHNDIAVSEKVVERTNEVINNQNIVLTLLNALLTVQKVNVERNIKASDQLVYKAEKDAYVQALAEIEDAKCKLAEISNLVAVYEKTEIKEIVVEKEVDKLSGRV